MPDVYTVSDYIVDRLSALGLRHIFAVAGNYTASFLITAQGSGKITCIGTTNEMEAGYAADAYARLNGLGVACVTYGVGSLSLLNAIAGAYVERCPVVVINGSANAKKAEQLVQQGVLFAHAIDPLRTDELIFRPITEATAVITDGEDAPAQVDRVLRACLASKRPVYLEVRDGVWEHSCSRPEHPELPLARLPSDQAHEKAVEASVKSAVDRVTERLRAAERPVLWGGEELQRLGVEDAFEELVSLTRLPYTTTLLGKSLISEDNDRFIGVYDSLWAPDNTKKVVEGADCLIALGTILSDFYGSLVQKSYERMILASSDAVRIGHEVFQHVPLDRFIRELVERCRPEADGAVRSWTAPPGFHAAQRTQLTAELRASATAMVQASVTGAADPDLTWETCFQLLHSFVDENMLVVVDTSFALFPAAELLIRKRKHFIAQAAWLSIGYSVGAVVGASMTLSEGGGKRAVALAGDGGFQMTATALSTLARYRQPAIVFVFDNGLYAIEQFLVDKTYYQDAAKQPVFFNELARWDYVKLAESLGCSGRRARTLSELRAALDHAKSSTDQPCLISVDLPARDVPPEIRASLQPLSHAALGSKDNEPGGQIAVAGLN
ncbi:hypothetical protein DC522_30750 [Microvirga sp. KLBC 81]|uniref:alpha-keto acid decarboxylase family protein n=1 Tax=Microvirga sp. KLBC 81 TaxID=1862707 RepID=UPI000D51EB04|nr:thiamine pyrophosphate-binding protein [Microvirga sp. KLBC 81]PVE20698.1 hypothetical protein DC522_30750 [Microvirga sp. KLBC 81]